MKRTARLLNGKDVEVDLSEAIFASLARTGEIRTTCIKGSDPKTYLRFISLARLPKGQWLADGLESNTDHEFRKAFCSRGVRRLVEIQEGDALAALAVAGLEIPLNAGAGSRSRSRNNDRDNRICELRELRARGKASKQLVMSNQDIVDRIRDEFNEEMSIHAMLAAEKRERDRRGC